MQIDEFVVLQFKPKPEVAFSRLKQLREPEAYLCVAVPLVGLVYVTLRVS